MRPADAGHQPASVAPGQSPNAQIQFVHLLRGLAAMMVLWSHLSGYWLYENGRGWVVQDLWARYVAIPFHLYQNAGHLGVILFFLISGYIITHASLRESGLQFLIKRSLRIFPLLATAVALSVLVMHLNQRWGLGVLPGLEPGSLGDYLGAAFLVDQYAGTGYTLGPTWTLAIEVVFYAMVCTAISVRRLTPQRSTWYMIAAWAAMTPVILATPALTHLATTFVYLAFLLGGRVVYLLQRDLMIRGEALTAMAIVATLFLFFYTVAFPGQLLIQTFEPLATYVIAIIAFGALLRIPVRRVAQPFRFFGDASYSIYLMHIPVGMIAINISISRGLPFTVAFIAGTIATLGASFATNRLVERPAQSLARRLSRKVGKHGEVGRSGVVNEIVAPTDAVSVLLPDEDPVAGKSGSSPQV